MHNKKNTEGVILVKNDSKFKIYKIMERYGTTYIEKLLEQVGKIFLKDFLSWIVVYIYIEEITCDFGRSITKRFQSHI